MEENQSKGIENHSYEKASNNGLALVADSGNTQEYAVDHPLSSTEIQSEGSTNLTSSELIEGLQAHSNDVQNCDTRRRVTFPEGEELILAYHEHPSPWASGSSFVIFCLDLMSN